MSFLKVGTGRPLFYPHLPDHTEQALNNTYGARLKGTAFERLIQVQRGLRGEII